MSVTPGSSSSHFLKGPIPWWWIARAAPLPSQALLVGLVCWLWAGMRRSYTIRLSSRVVFPALGLSRFTVYRAVHQLEQAELIVVRRRRGHPPIITIVRQWSPPAIRAAE